MNQPANKLHPLNHHTYTCWPVYIYSVLFAAVNKHHRDFFSTFSTKSTHTHTSRASSLSFHNSRIVNPPRLFFFLSNSRFSITRREKKTKKNRQMFFCCCCRCCCLSFDFTMVPRVVVVVVVVIVMHA